LWASRDAVRSGGEISAAYYSISGISVSPASGISAKSESRTFIKLDEVKYVLRHTKTTLA